MINDDHYNSNDNIMKNLLLNKYNIYDLENIITHNDTMIILCLLELIIHNIPLKYNTCIKNIYNNYVIADIYEKYFFTYNIKYIREFILYLTCSCTRYINQDNIFINNYSYNKYNSKSSIICQKFYNYNIISKILHDIYNAKINNDFKMLKIYNKKYKKYKKIFNDIYLFTF